MMIIGLTGSIAMGKSEAARILAAYGVPVFDSDAEVHRLYDSEQGAKLIAPFVPEATRENKVNREFVTKAVLADGTLLSKLEKVVHAEIRQRRKAFIETANARGVKAVIVDIPLLFETDSQKDVDKTIVVSASAATQKARVLARPNMTEERFKMILGRQMPDEEKCKIADVIIQNDGTIEELKAKLMAQMQKWGI